jgi:flagellar biosynthesis/type III secretory pathway M-ring protein FliF/YscJ
MVLNSFLYALIIFVALGVISLLIAIIMRLMYAILHKNGKKAETTNKVESNLTSQ